MGDIKNRLVKVENNNEYSIGDEVWWINPKGEYLHGVITDFDVMTVCGENVMAGYIHLAEECAFPKCYMNIRLSICWPSKEECMRAQARQMKLQTEEYKKSIETVEDLVRFLFTHDCYSEDHDYDAEEAARISAKELLGIDLPK